MQMLFSANGIINNAIVAMGGNVQSFLSGEQYFRPMYIGSTIWRFSTVRSPLRP